MKNKSVGSVFRSIVTGFQKYNLTIFIVVLTSGLAVAVLLLNSALQEASNTSGYNADSDPTSFDQATIDRVKQLHTSSEITGDTLLPEGRVNPFAE